MEVKIIRKKEIELSDGRLVFLNRLDFSLMIAYGRFRTCYDSEQKIFRALICRGVIDGFTQNDYEELSDDDLEIIAGGILATMSSTKHSGESALTNLFIEMDRELKEMNERPFR